MRDRNAKDDDPTIIRHLHDLAALETLAAAASMFRTVLSAAATADTGRDGGRAPADPTDRFALMLERLSTERMWPTEYEEFVHNVSFARADEEISFTAFLDATRRLVEIYKRYGDSLPTRHGVDLAEGAALFGRRLGMARDTLIPKSRRDTPVLLRDVVASPITRFLTPQLPGCQTQNSHHWHEKLAGAITS